MSAAQRTAPAAPRTDSRQLVLDQAARLFREQGYAETSLRDIADACGIKTASLYYHFSGKDEIVIEVLNTGVATVFAEARRSVQALGMHAPADKQIRAAIAAHLRALLELDDYTGANIRIFGHVPPPVRQATMPQREQYEDWLRTLLRTAAVRGAIKKGTDLRLLRLLLLGAMNWAVEWHRPRRGKTDDVAAIADAFADMVLHGVLQATPAVSRPRRINARRG